MYVVISDFSPYNMYNFDIIKRFTAGYIYKLYSYCREKHRYTFLSIYLYYPGVKKRLFFKEITMKYTSMDSNITPHDIVVFRGKPVNEDDILNTFSHKLYEVIKDTRELFDKCGSSCFSILASPLDFLRKALTDIEKKSREIKHILFISSGIDTKYYRAFTYPSIYSPKLIDQYNKVTEELTNLLNKYRIDIVLTDPSNTYQHMFQYGIKISWDDWKYTFTPFLKLIIKLFKNLPNECRDLNVKVDEKCLEQLIRSKTFRTNNLSLNLVKGYPSIQWIYEFIDKRNIFT